MFKKVCFILITALSACFPDLKIHKEGDSVYYVRQTVGKLDSLRVRISSSRKSGLVEYGQPIQVRISFFNESSKTLSLLVAPQLFTFSIVPIVLHGPTYRSQTSSQYNITLQSHEEYSLDLSIENYESFLQKETSLPSVKINVTYQNRTAQINLVKYDTGYVISENTLVVTFR